MSSEPGEYDGGFGVAAAVMTAIGQQHRAGYERGMDGMSIERRFDVAHQIPIGPAAIPISGGNGVYQMNDLLMPKAGYMWSIRRLTLSGYTAGTVVAYKGGNVVGTGATATYTGGGEPFPFSSAGAATIGRGELLLDQGDALVIVCGTLNPGGVAVTLATGFTNWVQLNGAADCIERWYQPRYIG